MRPTNPVPTVDSITTMLNAASCERCYAHAKRRAARLSTADQFAVVDAFIAARKRILRGAPSCCPEAR